MKHKAVKENEPIIENWFVFAPGFYFTRKTICDDEKKMVPLNNVDQYILFPSKCFHQGL